MAEGVGERYVKEIFIENRHTRGNGRMSDRAGPLAALQENPLLASLRQATMGDYEILAELGRGGMAVVYLAHDLALDRKVAIKVMLPGLLAAEGAAERFKREARTAASISHPNIIPIYAVKEHEDLLYFVMQFVGGRTLNSVIEQIAPMPIPMIETILTQVGEALAFGHRHGVVHRDVKPGNILLDEEGRAVVTDFGIAKASVDQSITRTGGVVGTPLYMSPEQCSGEPVTGNSDQYSLGLLGYEMLTGKPPFSGENPIQLMYQRCTESPTPVTDLRTDCPERLAAVVMRMLERKPEDRWPTLHDAVEAIGTPSPTDTIRRQMAALAKTGHSQRILAQMTTPTSPVPATKSRAAMGAGAHRTATIAPATQFRNWRGAIGWMAAIAAVVLGTVWAVSQRQREGTPEGGGLSESTTVSSVGPASVAAVLEITPQSADLEVGESVALEAVLRTESGDIIPDSTIAWESSNVMVARVSDVGVVTALAGGVVSVTARVQGQAASANLRIRPPEPGPQASVPAATPPRGPVVSLVVVPATASMVPGASMVLRASLRDRTGRTLPDSLLTWASDDEAVATVSAAGMVVAIQRGSARVSATRDGVTGSSMIVVSPVPVASISIMPPTASLLEGETLQFLARVRSADGSILADRTITWSTRDSAILRVSPDGLATGVASGTTAITAQHENHLTDAAVSVTAPAEEERRPKPETVRRDIEMALESFARAVESHDLGAVRRAYPGMTEDEAQAYAKLLPTVDRLTMTIDGPLEAVGTRRVATGRAHYRYGTPRTFEQTFEYRAELDHVSGRWQLMSIRFQEP